MSKILTLEVLLSQGRICEMMVPEILTWVETQFPYFFIMQTLSQRAFILVWWKSVYNFLLLRSPEDITLLNWKHRWLYYFLCNILQKNLITHSHVTLLAMKRLHKQYFHLTNASGILKEQQRIKLKEFSSTFAAAVKFAVTIKGIENAFDKKIPRNSEYGTSNKNFYIQVFWTRYTLKGFIKLNMITPCCPW